MTNFSSGGSPTIGFGAGAGAGFGSGEGAQPSGTFNATNQPNTSQSDTQVIKQGLIVFCRAQPQCNQLTKYITDR